MLSLRHEIQKSSESKNKARYQEEGRHDRVPLPVYHLKLCYSEAEKEARAYFNLLLQKMSINTHIAVVSKKLKEGINHHVPGIRSLRTCFEPAKPDPRDIQHYLPWLQATKRMDSMLDRSVAFVFMRDLGQPLDAPKVQQQMKQVIHKLKQHILKALQSHAPQSDAGLSFLYQKAKEEGLSHTMIWLMEKIKLVSAQLPPEISHEHAMRKLVKLVAGVTLHQVQGMDATLSPEEKTNKLDAAIRIGYYYGITYPLIDDILDSNRVLSVEERKICANMIRKALETGEVPSLGPIEGKNKPIISFMYSELKEAFEAIKAYQTADVHKTFLEQSYVFYQSQEADWIRTLENPHYSNEDIFIPVILKSASSRKVARSILGKTDNKEFDERTFYFGIFNQLHDDMKDLQQDLAEGQITPFTYYLKHHKVRPDLINPFEIYWSVVANLIQNVYSQDLKAQEVILERVKNFQKGLFQKGRQQYDAWMQVFGTHSQSFNQRIRKIAAQSNDTIFLDKMMSQMVSEFFLRQKHQEKTFVSSLKRIGQKINAVLPIEKDATDELCGDTLVKGANYSLEAGGKRIRPLLAYAMSVMGYGMHEDQIKPLLRSIEYMHTASLIFDDLPSQDNADLRRGRPTLHQHLGDTAAAELTGVFLIEKATEELASLNGFEPKRVQAAIRYSSRVIQDMCKGQHLDLASKNKPLSLEKLETLSRYKTGIAIEASLLIPALLAGAPKKEMDALRKFANHAGIAFQIQDDILDVEGDTEKLGKTAGKDAENHSATFVSVLGLEAAKIQLYDHYFSAMKALQDIPRNTDFLKQVLNYIVNRDR